ncbi:MAG: hypothetical protein P4L93_11990 [Coriobacteriia bacterium]|nr:hypothetical protein [Coriobacteriia bacterium]
MPLEDLAEQKTQFLRRFGADQGPDVARARALQDAIASAVVKNALYAPAATASNRYDASVGWKQMLESIAAEYVEPSSPDQYEADLVRLQAHMNRGFGQYFRQARHPKFGYEPGFRISHAQKSLGLVLKHYWCLGLVAMPPECPVDRPVLVAARAGELNSKWTDVNSIAAHRFKMRFLAEAAAEEALSIAEWELKVVNAL